MRILWKGGLAILGAIAISTVGVTGVHAQTVNAGSNSWYLSRLEPADTYTREGTPAGRFHRVSHHSAGFSTGIVINGYPRGSHHWPETQPLVPPQD